MHKMTFDGMHGFPDERSWYKYFDQIERELNALLIDKLKTVMTETRAVLVDSLEDQVERIRMRYGEPNFEPDVDTIAEEMMDNLYYKVLSNWGEWI